ncbi:DNA repair photolyase [Halopolyspora algeriensis]|uniref:DNA repair photolyase n=1 Tax=Halopolyspora algeriensis TaxID=1500506 RepID=A0A368VQK9_9ACTN|nr:Rv2578c family radical SAM protein [Halopolyspora algeriensis]RCW43898.1 DNA repair photolyase [Halopolyspora algeriensis]TQM53599.1 DNA repair photolyase [Halopolyspora algeriensis]
MRWEGQRVTGVHAGGVPELPLDLPEERDSERGTGRAGLRLPDPVPIEAGTAETYAIEITAKSIINRVPGSSGVPFEWTLNPYRGCGHACRYCFARNTHTYLDLDSGHDFDSKVVVKVNAGSLLRRELAAPRWTGESIAMGTNTDPYQRAEGHYRLMREILAALRDAANPFSILTKGTLILRDLDLLREAAERTRVSVAVSVGSIDEALWRTVEPGAPSPLRRLDVVRRFAEVGIGCTVLMAPILPGLSDSAERIEHTVAAIARAGAESVTPLVLHLRPGAREWYHAWLQREHPELLPLYERLYRHGAYAPKAYQRRVAEMVRSAEQRHGLGTAAAANFREGSPEEQRSDTGTGTRNECARSSEQLTLF